MFAEQMPTRRLDDSGQIAKLAYFLRQELPGTFAATQRRAGGTFGFGAAKSVPTVSNPGE
jgi:hypothetical protein